MSKRVTNSDIYHELGALNASVKSLRAEIREMAPRLRSLETFRSYVKGASAVVSTLVIAIFAALKGTFGHF